MVKICSNCGKENEQNMDKCVYCGSSLIEDDLNEKSIKSMYETCYDRFVSSKRHENIDTIIRIIIFLSLSLIGGIYLILNGNDHGMGFNVILIGIPFMSIIEIFSILDDRRRGRSFLMEQAKNLSIDEEYYQETDEKIEKYAKTKNLFIGLLLLLIVSLVVSGILVKYKGLSEYIFLLPYAIYIMGLIKLLHVKTHNLDNKKIKILFKIYVIVPGVVGFLLTCLYK